MGNVYDYAVPKDMPNGLYWYHSHRHTMTAQQTYAGLAGLLEIGRPDGNLPLVTQNDVPIRDMALQYNFVFDRKGNGHQLNDPNWPQFVSTLTPPEGTQLADGTYEPSLAPVNFSETTEAPSTSPTGIPGRCRRRTIAGRTSSCRAISRVSAMIRRIFPPTRRCRTTNATCSTRSTGSSSRS